MNATLNYEEVLAEVLFLDKQWNTLNPIAKAELYKFACALMDSCDSIKQKAKKSLMKGEKLPGLSLKQPASRFSITDVAGAYEAISLNFPECKDKLYTCMSFTMSKLESLLRPEFLVEYPAASENETKGMVREMLKPYATIAEVKPVIVITDVQ